MTTIMKTLDLLEFTPSTLEESEGSSPWLSIHEMNRPALLLSPPFGLSAEIPNNAWMERMSPEGD